MTELTKGEQLLIRTCYEVLERASKRKTERDAARRQAATYAAHIEDLSDQIDELRAERDEAHGRIRELGRVNRWKAPGAYKRLREQRDLWRDRALLARKAYHHAKRRNKSYNSARLMHQAWLHQYDLAVERIEKLEAERDRLLKRNKELDKSNDRLHRAYNSAEKINVSNRVRRQKLEKRMSELQAALQAAQNWARKESYQSDDYTEGYPPKGTCTWCLATPAEECWDGCPGDVVAAALGNGDE